MEWQTLQNLEGNGGANIGKYVEVSELAQETDLESVGEQLMGSNPIFDTI